MSHAARHTPSCTGVSPHGPIENALDRTVAGLIPNRQHHGRIAEGVNRMHNHID